MPVTILLKAIGMTPETIVTHFFDFDNFDIKSEGAMLEFVPERWKGEVVSFDIKDRDGNVIVEKDKRVNAKHLRDLGAAKVTYVSVPEEFQIGRVLARNVISPETGEAIANANDEITESLLAELRAAEIHDIQNLYTYDLDRASHLLPTLRSHETPHRMAARVAIYRMIRACARLPIIPFEASYQRLLYRQ